MEDFKPVVSSNKSSDRLSPDRLYLYKALVIIVFFLFLAGALTIPFYFETQTLWYKVGMNKTLLRAGHLAGMLTLVLLFLQVTLSTRSTFLETLFGTATLLRWHRKNGVVVAFLASSHVLLVLVPEGLAHIPLGKKYWPEMVGIFLYAVVLSMVVSSHFRQKLKLDYALWRGIHKPLGYLVIILVAVHVFFVSESFEQNVPKFLLLFALVGLFLQVIVVKQRLWRSKKNKK